MATRPASDTPDHAGARPPPGWLRLGRLGRPFQLHGALRLHGSGPAAEGVVLELARAGATVWLSGAGPTRLREGRRVGGGVVVAFQGAYSPERARAHVHRELWAEPAAVAAARAAGGAEAEPDVVLELLEGAAVRVDGVAYGTVARVVAGAQDLLLVDGPDGPRWVPWAAPYVRWDGTVLDIDDPPPGLLDDA